MNRQDIAGFSSESTPSNYAVIGVPGWISTSISGFPHPHPDYFLAILWKQLIGNILFFNLFNQGNLFSICFLLGTTVLKSVPSNSSVWDAHVWCSSGRHGVPSFVPVVSFVNIGDKEEVFTPHLESHRHGIHTEYIFTSLNSPSYLRSENGEVPQSLFNDVSYLNGIEMKVNEDGTLPSFPFKGKQSSGPIKIPPYSYG